uniref:CSON012484 protein n=1 Tax=Culicoides sonorensis TaxID=179676 RepID=A0A336KPA8_CULSO
MENYIKITVILPPPPQTNISNRMSSSERSIPHLRDIFSINSYSSGYNYTTQNPHNNPYNGVDHHANHPSNNNLINQKSVSRKKRDNNKTLTSGDIKTLERHLSMKKTIRKKIMRDLQQMYTDDPNEFKTENTEQLKAEVRTDVLRFGERQTTASKKSDNFLDMLRGENTYLNNNSAVQRHDYDYDSATSQQQKEKQSFWKRFTMKGKSNR